MTTTSIGNRTRGQLARLIFDTMGTVVSVTTQEPLAPDVADHVKAVFEDDDHRFSTYRPDSEISAFNDRLVTLRHCSPRFRDTYWLAKDWSMATLGAFTPDRPDGNLDLSGVVKSLAIESAGQVLDEAGVTDWCLNAGGDVLVRGIDPARMQPWVAGIVDPFDRTALVSQASCTGLRRAVATSGTSERGEHVWRMESGAPGRARFTQVTVVADEILTADVLATAILAGGAETLLHCCARWGVDVLAFETGGRAWATRAFRRR